jgi:TRAP-type C4-dicarboxylate transport system permease large subunit
MIPQMKARGYGADYAVNVTSMAALIALLLPPSHNMIIYSISAGGKISIADLFTAGIMPGLLLAASLMVTAYFVAASAAIRPSLPRAGSRSAHALRRRHARPAAHRHHLRRRALRRLHRDGKLLHRRVYALLVTFFVYRQLTWENFVDATLGAVRTTAMVLLIIGTAAAFGWLMAFLQVPAQRSPG